MPRPARARLDVGDFDNPPEFGVPSSRSKHAHVVHRYGRRLKVGGSLDPRAVAWLGRAVVSSPPTPGLLEVVPSSSGAGHELEASSLGIAGETRLAGIVPAYRPASV